MYPDLYIGTAYNNVICDQLSGRIDNGSAMNPNVCDDDHRLHIFAKVYERGHHYTEYLASLHALSIACLTCVLLARL